MVLYYFDIETAGLDPRVFPVVTIQYQPLDESSLRPLSDLVILKTWELGERAALKDLLALLDSSDPFEFIPVGVNVLFDLAFVWERAKQYGLVDGPAWRFLYEKPFVDLKPLLVILNNFSFRNFSRPLDTRMRTATQGRDVPRLFAEGRFGEIEEYVREEARAFLELLRLAVDHVRSLEL